MNDTKGKSVIPIAQRVTRRCRGYTHAANIGSDCTPEECQFLIAMQALKEKLHYRRPTWPEVLRAAKSIGYQKGEGANHVSSDCSRPPRLAGADCTLAGVGPGHD